MFRNTIGGSTYVFFFFGQFQRTFKERFLGVFCVERTFTWVGRFFQTYYITMWQLLNKNYR